MKADKKMIVALIASLGLFMSGCAKEEVERVSVTIPTNRPAINSENYNPVQKEEITEVEDIVYEELGNDKATKHITYISGKNKDFYKTIENNPIDAWFNDSKVDSMSSMALRKVISEYQDLWEAEALSTSTELLSIVEDEELRKELNSQWDAYEEYVKKTKKLYGLFSDKDTYVVATRDMKKNIMIALAEKSREFTILLKEYVYLNEGDISFALNYVSESEDAEDVNTDEDMYDEDSSVKSTISMYHNYNLRIVNNEIINDIVKDSCSEVLEMNRELSGGRTNKILISMKLYEYWGGRMKGSNKKLADIMEEQDKAVLSEQYEAFKKYVSANQEVSNTILENSKRYKTLVERSGIIDTNIALANAYEENYFEYFELLYLHNSDVMVFSK
ncbi:MAG: hypothetical protein K6G26_12550 [Lachnospiraceae bacterium]|nr:hypothetical protein [Lachnospiraceae bacterium]